jgi:hypothetical protein
MGLVGSNEPNGVYHSITSIAELKQWRYMKLGAFHANFIMKMAAMLRRLPVEDAEMGVRKSERCDHLHASGAQCLRYQGHEGVGERHLYILRVEE